MTSRAKFWSLILAVVVVVIGIPAAIIGTKLQAVHVIRESGGDVKFDYEPLGKTLHIDPDSLKKVDDFLRQPVFGRPVYVSSPMLNDRVTRAISRLSSVSTIYGLEEGLVPVPVYPARALANLRPLRKLSILVAYCEVGSEADSAFECLPDWPKMSSLYVKDAHVTDRGVAYCEGHPSLAHVYLNGPELTDQCLESLKRVPSLKLVGFGPQNRVTEAAIREFLLDHQTVEIGHGQKYFSRKTGKLIIQCADADGVITTEEVDD